MGKLVRLELFNFKSYKGHQTIEFGDSYFTSIIGPNGSGKSNSMDAISFVLGIKSSHLRSAHLKDLIYRGRVLRSGINKDQPTNGAIEDNTQSSAEDPKSAWVMAVYTDDEGTEHLWKRSIMGSGASEYRINGRQVTAAAYNDALEHENILIKARNFLVFQGDVEAIASQSPRDLTRLIEQISGSLEYKSEYDKLKIEQEKAAETSNFNLNRRRGINAEIKQYQEQKKEAENYQAKAGERDEAVVTHILWKLFHFQQTMDQNKAEIERHQEELKEQRRQHEKFAGRLDEAKSEMGKAQKGVSKQERAIRKKEKEAEEKEGSLVPVDEKISIAAKNLRKYEKRAKDIKRDQDTQTAMVTTLKKELDVVRKAQTRFDTEQKKLAEQTGTALSDTDIAEYNKLKERVSTQIATEQIKIDNYTRQLKTDVEGANSLKSKVEHSQWNLEKLQNDVQEYTERRETMKTAVAQAGKEIDAKKKEYNAMSSERLRTEQKRTELDEKLQECLQKLLEADDGRRETERERRMKDTITALKRIYQSAVRGRIGDLCKPKMKKYGEAVSTVLGRHWDAIVVDNEKTAKDCIEYLRDQRQGQATFLPLDSIIVKPLNANLKGMHRGMRMAIDTIEFDGSVERAMIYATGNAVVCDDLEVAKYICYEKGLEVKAVTLDGTVIHKGGLMTGGRVGAGGTRRWEDQEVEALRRLKDNLRSQLEALPPRSRRDAQEEALQGDLIGLEQRLAYARDELKTLERNLDSKKKELAHTKRVLSEQQPALEEANASVQELKDKLETLQTVVSAAEDKVFSDFCKRLGYADIRDYEARQGSLQQEAAQKQLEFTTQISKLMNQLVFEERRLGETTERIKNLLKLASRDETMTAELEAEKQQIQEELDAIASEVDILKDDLGRLKEELANRAAKVDELKREVAKRVADVEGSNKTISSAEAELERSAAGRYAVLRRCKLEEIELPLAAGSESLASLPIDDIAAEDDDAMDVDNDDASDAGLAAGTNIPAHGIEVTYDSLPPELQDEPTDGTETSLLEKIKVLTSELERMAPNMKAISRLSGVEARLHSTEQAFEASRQAAKKARDNFVSIRTKRLTLFTRAFNHIAGQIGAVYKDLTKSATFPLGGTAYLDMEDSEEPYLDGIKYHAMPPMKRFRDMEHLSGGEKTMAALALLFAVHSFQPSPFFVLDEVDAALDNANVQRVANYVRQHAGPGFQFVVISLKSGLFEKSEALVGIYRDQGECSSRCLTLDLRKYVDA